MGKRPDYAAVVYGNLIRRTYKHTPVILGGIEASLRRLGHYDYWSGRVKRSVLLDSGADMISYGMGERSVLEIAEALEAGIAVSDLTYVDGTMVKVKDQDSGYIDAVMLPSFQEISEEDRRLMPGAFIPSISNTDPFSGKRLAEPYRRDNVCRAESAGKTTGLRQEMDDVYALPFMRTWHPCL